MKKGCERREGGREGLGKARDGWMWEAIHSALLCSFILTSSICLSNLLSTRRNSTSLFDYLSAPEQYLTAEQATHQNLTALPFLNNAEFKIILF